MRSLVLLNPGAGGATARAALRASLPTLPDEEITETRGGWELRALARGAADRGFERVVAAGGDGTIHEVVNGLAEAARPPVLGVIPLGTANDFARSLALPEDVEEAVGVLVEGRSRRIDLGEARGPRFTRFANVVVGGFGGLVGERADTERKRALGPLEYLRSAAERLPELEAYRVRVEMEGERLELDVYHAVVANGGRSGGNVPVAPEAKLDDGLLDVVLVPALRAAELVALIPRLLRARHLADDRVVFRRTARLSLRSEPPMRFSVDGEPLGEGEVAFRVLPGALEVTVPRT